MSGKMKDDADVIDMSSFKALGEQGAPEMSFDPFFTEHDDATAGDDAGHTSFTDRRRVDLVWENLGFSVGVKSGGCCGKKSESTKVILKGVSGQVKSGQMLAVMGSSGAGKTTLLNLLAGRLTTSKNFQTEGQILVNGKKRNPKLFKFQSAYVEQEDKIFAEITVREQIEFSARMRLPTTIPREKKEERIAQTIQELGLAKVIDSYVGGENLRGVSGGEKKRVNVGTELVTDPSLLFLDEPTSGLDSFNALNVMYTLRKLASNGRTIVTTIHQPRSNIFSMFDYLCLLSEGQVMYFGPAADAVTYFSGLNFRCPPQFNPADYFIDLLSVDPRNPVAEAKSRKRIEYFGEQFSAQREVQMLEAAEDDPSDLESMSKFRTSWIHEFMFLLGRQWRLITRERVANGARIGQTIFFSILLGLVWLNVGRQDWSDPQVAATQAFNIGGIMFFVSINQAFGGVFGVIFVYPLERAVVLKERASGTYRVSAYMISKTIAEMPRALIQVLFFTTIIYWMIGLRADVAAFFIAFYIVLMSQLIAEGLTLCISTLLPDPQAAAAIVPLFIILSMLFGGFLIDSDTTPSWIAWVRWVSFVNYCFQGLMNNQFNCDGCGKIVIERIFIIEFDLWVSCLALLGMYFFFRILWYIILRRTGPKYDRSL
mmetsp:Transcript_4887/g.13109  ORF Transcript_4887/g.13109 Transcript_4887/m.13109 type:complete len:654 (-) Transcript_4887:39-2000(-)